MDNMDDVEKIFSEENRSFEAMEQKYKLVTENASDVITVFNLNLKVVYVSQSVLRLRGFTHKEAIKQSIEQIISPETADFVRKILKEELKKEDSETVDPNRSISLEVEALKKDGSTIIMEMHLSFLRNLDGIAIGIIATNHDITKRKKTEKSLQESESRYRELSIVDDLTQLYNSRHFHDQLRLEVSRTNRYKQPLTLILLDLDNFKSFNDLYGHEEANEVLMRLGQVVKRCLRETDSAYRYGGEEFTILLPMATSNEGIVLAKRIRTQFKEEAFCPAPGQKVHATMSIGVAQYKMKEEVKTFVQRADQLMYQAKIEGKDRVCSESAV